MSRTDHTRLAGVVIVAMLALNCGDLVFAWGHSPYDRAGGIAFAIWALGGVALGWRQRANVCLGTLSFAPGLLLGLLGFLADLNVLKHIGLAWAVAGFIPGGWRWWLWGLAAISWMPVMGWMLSGNLSMLTVNVGRIAVAFSSVVAINLGVGSKR
jgi:hypothetical protein